MTEKPCFECNGTGLMCDCCGEAENVCCCEDEPGSMGKPHCSDCECCEGTGYVEVGAPASGEESGR